MGNFFPVQLSPQYVTTLFGKTPSVTNGKSSTGQSLDSPAEIAAILTRMKKLVAPPLSAAAPTKICLLAAVLLAVTAGAAAQSPVDERAARAAARAEARSHLKMDPAMVALMAAGSEATHDPAKKLLERLGEDIFRDRSLSEPAGQSCASCHHLDRHFSSTGFTSEGAVAGLFGFRNAPTLTYTMFTPILQSGGDDKLGLGGYFGGQFRDGQVDTLAEQVPKPMLNPIEMNNPDTASIVAKIAVAPYAGLFEQIYGAGVFKDTDAAFADMVAAIVAYETGPQFRQFDSKFDAYRRGGATLSDSEARGLALFNDTKKANCVTCHLTGPDKIIGQRPLLTDFGYDNIGVPRNPGNKYYKMASGINPDGKHFRDPGLGAIIFQPFTYGQFKSPSLRNVAVSGPYMHNGYFKTLRGVLDFYNTRDVKPRCADRFVNEADAEAQGCWPVPETPQTVNTVDMGNLHLSDQDIDDIIAFLGTLTDGYDAGTAAAH
jgi:cytochrome c peroxidase